MFIVSQVSEAFKYLEDLADIPIASTVALIDDITSSCAAHFSDLLEINKKKSK